MGKRPAGQEIKAREVTRNQKSKIKNHRCYVAIEVEEIRLKKVLC